MSEDVVLSVLIHPVDDLVRFFVFCVFLVGQRFVLFFFLVLAVCIFSTKRNSMLTN